MSEIWRLPARFDAPEVARRLLRGYAVRHGANREAVAAVALCVSEAVTNAVLHAYREAGEPGEIELEARGSDGHIYVHVRDEGVGMTPRVNSPGIGLGLPMIADHASSVEVRTPEMGGTEVVMRFDLADRAVTRRGGLSRRGRGP
jgi:stage II sporulation protein AB (anti-sigma F factor)